MQLLPSRHEFKVSEGFPDWFSDELSRPYRLHLFSAPAGSLPMPKWNTDIESLADGAEHVEYRMDRGSRILAKGRLWAHMHGFPPHFNDTQSGTGYETLVAQTGFFGSWRGMELIAPDYKGRMYYVRAVPEKESPTPFS